MTINEKKLKKQLEIIDLWVANKGRGTVEAATGFGKSFLAILTMQKILQKDSSRTITIIVPTIQLKEQWEDNLREHKINADVFVINSIAVNNKKLQTSLLVLDEIHRYASEVFGKIFDLVEYKWILGLTATMNRTDGKHEILEQKCPVIATITQEEAIQEEYISEFDEYNLGIDLDSKDRIELIKLNRDFHKFFGMFGHDLELAMSCCKKTGAELYAKANNLDPKMVGYHANMFNLAMRKRKEFLYKTHSKLETALKVLAKLPQHKTVTFSESTEFADNLTHIIGDTAVKYHSKMSTEIIYRDKTVAREEKINGDTMYRTDRGAVYTLDEIKNLYPGMKKLGSKSLKQRAISKFADNRTKVNVINTARALDEGFDVQDIELAIVTSSTSNPRQHIQRVGRALRKYVYKDGTVKRPIVVNIYIKDSQDEKWLKSRQVDPKTRQPLNKKIKWISSVDEIVI